MNGPYKGLEPYTQADSGYFFGRDVERRIIGANLRAARTTALYGESGVGKSSLLRAGVAHDFSERPDYALVILRNWREDPVVALLRAVIRTSEQWRGAKTTDSPKSWELSSARDLIQALLSIPEARKLLLVRDQFEEYFQYHPNGNHAADFRDLLAYLVLQQEFPLNVLISIREDALASLDRIKVLIPTLFDNCLRVEYLSRPSAAEAITKPLAHYYATESDTGAPITIDPGSVEQVIDEILSAQGGTSTRVQTPYLQLVMSAWWEREVENGAPTMTHRTLVEDLGGVRTIVDSHLKRTIDSLPPGQQELAARVFVHLVTPTGRKLAQTFSELAESSRMSHDQLESILEKFRSARVLSPVPSPHPAFPEERSYEFAHDVMAGVAAEWLRRFRQAEELAAAQREAEEARSRATEMRELAMTAQSAERRALARERIAFALLNFSDDKQTSLLLAMHAVSVTRDATGEVLPEAEELLHKVVLSISVSTLLEPGVTFGVVGWSPAGSRFAAVSGTEIIIFDANSRSRVLVLHDSVAVIDVDWSPNGEMLAAATGNSIRIWSADTGRQISVLSGPEGTARSVRWNPDGDHLASTSNDRTAIVWKLATKTVLRKIDANQGELSSVSWSPDGRSLATAGNGSGVKIWDITSGRKLNEAVGGGGQHLVAWSPDGKRLATGTARLYDAETGHELLALAGEGNLTHVVWSPNSKYLATTNSSGRITVWEAATGVRVTVFDGVTGGVNGVGWSPDGRTIVTTHATGMRLWEVGPGRELFSVRHPDGVHCLRWSPSERHIISGGPTGARVWDLETGACVFAVSRARTGNQRSCLEPGFGACGDIEP